MASKPNDNCIRLRGVRQNNLKGFDLDLPLGKLIVVTGLSGSGKSSFAFDTLYAEGQRRYIETFSPYARQFFDRMDKPRVDRIEGIPPAIAIEQRNSVRTTRSTVGTMTEICDYMKVLWPHLSRLYCKSCQREVRKDTPQSIWETLAEKSNDRPEVLVTFDLPLSRKLSLAESLKLIARQGYQRVLLKGEAIRIEEYEKRLSKGRRHPDGLTVVQDRLKLEPRKRSRFIEACEQAYHFGKGCLAIYPPKGEDSNAEGRNGRLFSNHFHCAECDLEYREGTPSLFSFNHPIGACPECKGFGRIITIDYQLAIPDRSLSLKEVAIKPWRSGFSAASQSDLAKFCRARKIPMNVPFRELSPEVQGWVIDGDPDYGIDEEHEWPQAWYGVKGYFRWLESKSYKMHVRVMLSRYRAYSTCPSCQGKRLQPEALQFQLPDESRISLADFYLLPIDQALATIQRLASDSRQSRKNDPINIALNEVRARLGYLSEVGLGYLTLNRPMRTLSGGETERVSLTSCLGTRLVNTLYILDEPSVGLHPRDTERLINVMRRLREIGNTVVVVEHEPDVMRAADQIIDLGPGHGESGGELVFQGTGKALLKSRRSLTGQYLSGRRRIEIPRRRPVDGETLRLRMTNANRNNLKNITLTIPLGRLVCVSGVSGSGKSTLIRDELVPALLAKIGNTGETVKASDRMDSETNADGEAVSSDTHSTDLTGWEMTTRVVLVDQSQLGKTPRSNPVVYIGAFDDIREVFARSDAARERGLNASSFSFNSVAGQCETCRGAGFEKIEMQFLSDVFIRCPDCDGKRYRTHIREVKVNGWSISNVLESTAEETIKFLNNFTNSRPAEKAVEKLKLLVEVGLGYLRLGQPINTLSGGECQRLKLVSYLADTGVSRSAGIVRRTTTPATRGSDECILFLFDEPTTGLHFDDVRVLIAALQRLVDAGHSVVVIEHNLELLKCADWIIDLGPEAGEGGGGYCSGRNAGGCCEGEGESYRGVFEGRVGREAIQLPGEPSTQKETSMRTMRKT